MGRGRAKAKQTKVARQLKYSSGGTDLSRLANELGASPTSQPPNAEPFEDDEEEDDPYAQYADRYNEDQDEDDQSSPSSQRRGA
jgi:phage terminase small subunit